MTDFSHIDILIEMALFEDTGTDGDVTSDAIFRDEIYSYRLVAKESGILCGIDVFRKVMGKVDPEITVQSYYRDCDRINNGDIIATVSGPVRSILLGERTALNFLSHLSGIATRTSLFTAETGGTSRILDTRKTLPGYRELEKYAVRCGGGVNHRMGLYDMVLVKDNHSDAAGGITAAVSRVRASHGRRFIVEVEARNMEEVLTAIENGADRIMLDNMKTAEIKKAVGVIAGRAETEASGNMTLDRIGEVSKTGVDYISVGELTHSVRAFDFSLKEIKKGDS